MRCEPLGLGHPVRGQRGVGDASTTPEVNLRGREEEEAALVARYVVHRLGMAD